MEHDETLYRDKMSPEDWREGWYCFSKDGEGPSFYYYENYFFGPFEEDIVEKYGYRTQQICIWMVKNQEDRLTKVYPHKQNEMVSFNLVEALRDKGLEIKDVAVAEHLNEED
jgi:hypothetical protein